MMYARKFLIPLMLLGIILFPTLRFLHARGVAENVEEEERQFSKLNLPLMKSSSFDSLKEYPLKMSGSRFGLGMNFRLKDTPFRFYVRDLKLRVDVQPNSYEFRMPGLDFQRAPKRWGRTLLEGAGHFLYATASYWIREDVMKEDWEYHFTWKDQKRRFFFLDGPRFDSNTFQFNWTHSIAGAIYYNYARTNRLTPLESVLFSIGASTFWEFVVEFKEVVSINDMIATPVGGISIGESFFQVSRVIRTRKPTLLNKIGAFLTNPIMSMNSFFDRNKPYPKIYADAGELWHDFRLSTGTASNKISTEKRTLLGKVSFDAEVMGIREYGEVGGYGGSYSQTLFTQLQGSLLFSDSGIKEFNVFTKAVLWGYFNQSIRETDEGESSGYSYFIGASTCFDLVRKASAVEPIGEEVADRTDKYCVINLLGPSFDLTLFSKAFKFRFQTDAYFDFAMVHSTAFQQYKDYNEVLNTKSTLKNHAYYYALGFTSRSMMQLSYKNVELKGKFLYHWFDSIEGLDRFQKEMADEEDYNLKDKRLNYGLSLGYTIPDTAVQLVLSIEKTDRDGWVETFHRNHSESRTAFQINYLF